MPAITTATRASTPEQQAGGSTTVNLVSTTAMAIGTAVVAVTLSVLLPIAGGLQALHGLDPTAHAALAPALAEADADSSIASFDRGIGKVGTVRRIEPGESS